MSEIDRYIHDLSSRLHVPRRERLRIVADVRDHLDDSLAHYQRTDEPAGHAIAQALDAFGPPRTLAAQFNAAAGTRAMRRAPVIVLSAGLVVLTGFLLAGMTQTHSATPSNATVATQTAFFFAVLSFQVAIVAGMCAASRALARWRAPVVRGDDRRFVRRCSVISVCALGTAALAWATTMRLALDRLADPNTFTLALGGGVMLVGAAVGIAATRRLEMNCADEIGDAAAATGGWFGLGERCIGFVRNHPVTSCVSVAAFSVYPAMSHAETTLPGALPWGLAQAATVILGFLLLGPTLGLRPSDEMTESGV